jgi:hypothetical protein
MNSIKSRGLPVIKWDELPALLTDVQLSVLIGISASALRKARSEGTIGARTPLPPFVRIGGRVRYKTTDVLSWVAALEAREAI